MDFPSAIRALAGNTFLIAFLDGGPVLVMNSHNHVIDVRNGKARTYTGKFSDYISIAWVVKSKDELAAMAAAEQAAARES